MYPNLNAEMKRTNKKYEDLANLLSLGISTISEKMRGISEFKVSELKIIKNSWFPNCSLDYLSVTIEEQNQIIETENEN